MTDLGPDQIKQLLGLRRHPTCGFVAETYRSAQKIPGATMPPFRGTVGLQPRDQLAAGLEFDAGAGEVAADGLDAAVQVRREERLDHGGE